jgi:hypothetical protein
MLRFYRICKSEHTAARRSLGIHIIGNTNYFTTYVNADTKIPSLPPKDKTLERGTMTKADEALQLVEEARVKAGEGAAPSEVWAVLHQQELLTPSTPFVLHQECNGIVYESVQDVKPSWIPLDSSNTNIHKMMVRKGFTTYKELYDWSIQSREEFWMERMETLDVVWENKPTQAFSSDNAAHTS